MQPRRCVICFSAAAVFVMSVLVGNLGGASPVSHVAPAAVVSIAKFKGNHDAAYSITMDDGSANQAKLAAPILEKYHFRATFFVIAGLTTDQPDATNAAHLPSDWCGVGWQQWRALAEKGHEIGSHTMTHPHLDAVKDPAALRREIVHSADEIQAKMGRRPISFAFPFSATNEQSLNIARKAYLAVRGHGLVYLTAGRLGRYNAYIDGLIKDGEAGVGILHGLDGVGWEPIKSEVFKAHVEYLARNQDKLWVDTMGNVELYCRQRDSAKIAVTGSTHDSVTFSLDCHLDSHQPLVPLTAVVCTTAGAVQNVTAHRGQQQLPCAVQGNNILVDGVPGGGPITVTWKPKAPAN